MSARNKAAGILATVAAAAALILGGTAATSATVADSSWGVAPVTDPTPTPSPTGDPALFVPMDSSWG